MLLNPNKCYWVIRLDIKSFYESINKEAVLEKLYSEYRLSPQTVFLLKQLFNTQDIKESSGVPRGLSVSSCLSELTMKYFDIEIKQLEGVYYYARFVDDIIIFVLQRIARIGYGMLSLKNCKTCPCRLMIVKVIAFQLMI